MYESYFCTMAIQETTLENSVTVVSENLAGYHSAAIGIWIDVGSRDEKPELNGISHFFEHMVFKGNTHRNALEIVYDIESRGGYINAFTTKENTCIYAKVIKNDLELATEIVCDMVNCSIIDENELKKERQVIVEEIRSAEDAPDEMVHDLFSMAVWDGDPLAQPIAGETPVVRKLGLKELVAHQKKVNSKFRIVVSAAGAIDHDLLVRQVSERLSHQKKSSKNRRPWKKCSAKHILKKRDIQQCNVVYGTQLNLKKDEERLGLLLFNVLFGDGMASRLFQKVREEQGLVYSVYSSIDNYDNSLGFSIAFSSDEKRAVKALQVIEKEIQDIVRNGITPEEVQFAKQAVTGSLMLKVESTTSRMTRIAKQVLRELPRESIEDTVNKIMAIDFDTVNGLVKKIFLSENWGSGAIVPKKTKLKVKDYLNF